MGFNRASSVYTGSVAGYDQPQFTSLVDQIQMRDNAKQKYNGGASSKKPLPGPFTGSLSGQMNAMNQNNTPNRMSQMPQMPMGPMGMNGMNPMMNPMMGGGQMPMMGMNQMQYPMYQQNELMMQQMYQQMLAFQAQQQANMYGQQLDPRMSMAMPSPNLGFQNPQQFPANNGFLNVGGSQQRPMSIMSGVPGGLQVNPPNRPYSTLGPPGMPPPGAFPLQLPPMAPMNNNGYTPSIAPTERSNIGLSARYRPVVTGNGMQSDNRSTVSSSMTALQASGGASDPGKIKGILKNKSPVPQVTVRDDDEDDDNWAKLAARKKKFAQNGASSGAQNANGSLGLQEAVRSVNGY